MRKKIKIGDIAVIGIVLFAALILFLCYSLPSDGDASKVLTVKNNGEERLYSLNDDSEFTISGNGHTLTVVIENGSVYVKEADCPDKVCVHSSKINRVGQVIACVPARITLGITGGEDSYDFIAG